MIDLIIKSYKPNLKNSSLKIYMTSLRKLNDGNDIKNIDFLKDYENIILKLSSKKNNTKKNYLNAIIITLKALKGNEGLIEQYEVLRDKYQKEYNDIMSAHSKTDTQEKNWITWETYLSMIEKVYETVKSFEKNTEWTETQLLKYQEYLLLNLYRVSPLRHDFHDMAVKNHRQFNSLNKSGTKDNYIVVPANGRYKFILNDYKTSAKYKQQILEIKDIKLKKIIKLFLKHNTSGYFIVSPTNISKAIDTNNLTKVLIGLSVKYTGKRVGSSMLRHIYLTTHIGPQLQEQAELAKMMGHSPEMQSGYVKKG